LTNLLGNHFGEWISAIHGKLCCSKLGLSTADQFKKCMRLNLLDFYKPLDFLNIEFLISGNS
jgi:hypothetical protein